MSHAMQVTKKAQLKFNYTSDWMLWTYYLETIYDIADQNFEISHDEGSCHKKKSSYDLTAKYSFQSSIYFHICFIKHA